MSPTLRIASASWPDLTAKEVQQIRHGEWRLDCPSMMVKSGASTSPTAFSGPGFIYQSPNGALRFHLYAARERNINEWRMYDSLRAGQIIPDRAYYSLVATDTKSRKWKAAQFIPDMTRAASGSAVLDSSLSEVSCAGRLPPTSRSRTSSLRLWILADAKIPFNARTLRTVSTAGGSIRSKSGSLNAWKLRALSIDFLIVKEDDSLLTVHSTTKLAKLPPNFEDGLIQTLQFVLGRPLAWSIIRKKAGRLLTIKVASAPLPLKHARFHAPLPPSPILDRNTQKYSTAPHRKLFRAFLKHCLAAKPSRVSLPAQLNAIYEASASPYVDAEALTLAVAIESVLASEFPRLGAPTARQRSALKALRAHIDTWNGDAEVKARIQGAFASFNEPRALDRMRELSRTGAISDNQWKAWQRLRNATAHAYQAHSLSAKELIDLVQQMEVLFYHLTFYAIGYKGPYMDFSSPDWPIRSYAPRSSSRRKLRTSLLPPG